MSSQTDKRPGFWGTLPGLITAIATLITALAGAGLIFNAVTNDGGDDGGGTPPPEVVEVEVPGVVGWWVDDAIATLVSEGFGAIEVPTPTDTMEEGHVYGQDPDGGDLASPGTRVTLYVAVPQGETADTL